MIFPTSIADFAKETDDYYFPPFTGTYVRIIRLLVSLATVVLTPTMLILMNNPQMVPNWLSFINTTDDYIIPFFFQFLLLEIVIDGLRLASLNTPDVLGNSFSMLGTERICRKRAVVRVRDHYIHGIRDHRRLCTTKL